jgi:acyl-coenzyme A thioesterase PaaI-like protein
VTDLGPEHRHVLPARLGVTARYVDERLILDVTPQPATMRHGVVRVSVLAYAVDGVSGIDIDDDPDQWAMTSDMTVRMIPVPAPARISAVNTVLRRGRRSVTCMVDLTTEDGEVVGSGSIGFARFPRRETDPPKPIISPDRAPALFPESSDLVQPLRDEAGIEVIDAAEGVVEVLVTSQLRNPAGTMQGAMVALVAEAAAEELVEARFGVPAVVTDLDLRYLAQAQVGPVRSRCQLLGTKATDPVLVELFDTSTDRLTTVVYTRASVVD